MGQGKLRCPRPQKKAGARVRKGLPGPGLGWFLCIQCSGHSNTHLGTREGGK